MMLTKKHGIWIASAGAAVVLVDAFAGVSAAKNNGTMPGWWESTLGPVESAVPVPLGLTLILAGAAVYFIAKG